MNPEGENPPVTFEAWLASPAIEDHGSLVPGESVANVLGRLWRKNGCKFGLVDYDENPSALTHGEARRLAHLLGIMDCFGFMEAGRIPVNGGPNPPCQTAVLDRLRDGWRARA